MRHLVAVLSLAATAACAASDSEDRGTTAGPTTGAGGSGGVASTGGSSGGGLADNGTECVGASECASGRCVDGVCCDSICDDVCSRCDLAGSEGTCEPVAKGTDPDGECGSLGCNGSGACAYAEHRWSAVFGDLGEDVVLDAGVNPGGEVVICGYVHGGIDFGGGTLTAHGSRDVFVAKLNASGGHIWSKVLGESTGSTNQTAYSCAFDGLGRVIVGGAFLGEVDFGGGVLAPVGLGSDMFVTVYSATGDHVWSKSWGSTTAQSTFRRVIRVLADPSDDLLIVGEFSGDIDWGSTVMDDGSGVKKSLFVAKLTDTGEHVWSKVLGTAEFDQEAGGLAVGPNGDVVLAASMAGSVSFGSTAHTSAGGFDVLVAKLDANGNHLWSKRFGDGAQQTARALALDGGGNVVVTGGFAGEINFGGGVLAANATDVFVAKLDGDGAHLWSQRFGAGLDQEGVAVISDAQDELIVGGSLQGSADFGGGTLSSAGGSDLFLVKLAADGAHRWSLRYGDGAAQRPAALALAPNDDFFVAAVVEGAIDFGGGELASAGQEDVAVALLGP